MSMVKLLSVTLLIVLSYSAVLPQISAVLPQTGVEAAKRKKELEEKAFQMLEQTASDANSIKLPQNRAVVYAMMGDLYWRFDSKKGRELFRSTAAEITNYYQELEKERRESDEKQPEGFDPADVRAEVLAVIASRDPELALELLRQTRPYPIAEAMALVVPGVIESGNRSPEYAKAVQEIATEERFSMMAAAADPERAAAAIKNSLAKGLSPNLVQLLQVVYRSDEKKAADLASSVISRMGELDLTKNPTDLNTATAFLSMFNRVLPKGAVALKIFNFSDGQYREMANKLSSTFLSAPQSPNLTATLTRILPTLEKVLPEKSLLLKQRDQLNRKPKTPAGPRGPGAPAFDPNASLEEILAQAAKLPTDRDRMPAYQFVSSRLREVTDDARAKKLIDQIGNEGMRKSATEQFESARVSRLIAADKLDEAKRAVGLLPNKHVRTQRLVSLALQFATKKGETDQETARTLMSEARAITNTDPQDEDDIADVMELVRGYASLDPAAAFRLVEPVIDQFNDITQASAVLSRYNKRDRVFKSGELVIRVNGNAGGMLPFRFVQQYQMLGRADIEKMSVLAERFTRPDARTVFRINALQGYVRATPVPR